MSRLWRPDDNAKAVQTLKNGLAEALVSEEHSDCKLICGPQEFNLHKIILMTQSGYFRSAFKKGAFKEGESGTIELKATQSASEASDEADDLCDDPEIVKLMVQFFYHLDYFPNGKTPSPDIEDTATSSDSETESPIRASNIHARRRMLSARMEAIEQSVTPITPIDPQAPALETTSAPVPSPPSAPTLETASPPASSPPTVYIIEHAKVFAMAVKSQVDGLRDLATAKFQQSVKTSWDHDDFAHTISIVYNSTADDIPQLRDIVLDVLHDHFDTLKHKAEFETVVTSIPGLAYALLKRVGTISICANGHKGKGDTKYCMGCYTNFDICTACKQWTWCPICMSKIYGMASRA